MSRGNKNSLPNCSICKNFQPIFSYTFHLSVYSLKSLLLIVENISKNTYGKKCVYNYWALLCCRHCMKYLIYSDPTNYLLFILREFMLRESKWLVHGHIVCKWQRPSLPESNNPALNLSTLPHKGTEFGHLTKPKWLFYGHQCFLSHCWDKSQWTIWNILFSIQLFPFYLTISQCVSNCKHLWIIYLSFISSQISTSFGISFTGLLCPHYQPSPASSFGEMSCLLILQGRDYIGCLPTPYLTVANDWYCRGTSTSRWNKV